MAKILLDLCFKYFNFLGSTLPLGVIFQQFIKINNLASLLFQTFDCFFKFQFELLAI